MKCSVPLLLGAALLSFVTPAPAETIRLITGEVLIGEVKDADFDRLKVHVVFPDERDMTLTTKQVMPETVHSILSVRLPASDVESRLKLAEYCLRSGLYAHAIVEARRVAQLDEAKRTRTKKIESLAWESIASTLLDDAKTHLAIEEPGLARMYLESVVGRYPDTDAAAEAKKLLKKLPESEPEAPRPLITETKRKDELRGRLTKARKNLEKADKRTNGMRRHFGPAKQDEHLLRRSEPYYRKAFASLLEASRSTTDDSKLNEEIRVLAGRARSQLCKVYLELGTLYLARGSINLAEQNCKRACQLEPENQASHGLHQKIIDARIALRFGT